MLLKCSHVIKLKLTNHNRIKCIQELEINMHHLCRAMQYRQAPTHN